MTLEKEDKIITEFLRSLGPWKKHILIGGGFAPLIYKMYLSQNSLQTIPVGTRDIDTLIPRKVSKESEKNISKHLKEAGFEVFFKDYEDPATEAYSKEIGGMEVEVEFLTDDLARINKHKNVLISGGVAQPLSYLSLSLNHHVIFKTLSGEEAVVVSPAAWVFHKALTFPKRKKSSKLLKDLYGIWYVTTQLGELSDEAVSEFKILSQQYKKWFKRIGKNLGGWLEEASPLEWSQLEAQEPAGKLKQISYERLIKDLLG